MARGREEQTAALFVRLPLEQAERLDRVAAALPARKKDLIAGLVDRHVDESSPEAMQALRELARGAVDHPRRVTLDLEDRPLPVGHHSFASASVPDVLTTAQAAELLAVDPKAILALAEEGAIPGRRIAGDWRFARRALLDWLAGAS